MNNILTRFLTKLPYNGDWIFVTESPRNKNDKDIDAETQYDTPSEVLQAIKTNAPEILKLIYDRAKAHELTIHNSADHIRDKAKALLSTVSFLSAVFLGVVPFFLLAVTKFVWWLIAFECLLFLLLASHLIHSLIIAMNVMTREQYVKTSPQEILSVPQHSKRKQIIAIKEATAQIMAYSNQTHEFIRQRGNKLILGQTAFKFGLLYFFIFIFMHISAAIWYGSAKTKDPLISIIEHQEKTTRIAIDKYEKGIIALKELTKEVSLLHNDNALILEQFKELCKTIKTMDSVKVRTQKR